MNHGSDAVDFTLSLGFGNDFADIFEVRGIKRERRGKVWSEVLGPDCVRLSYRGPTPTCGPRLCISLRHPRRYMKASPVSA